MHLLYEAEWNSLTLEDLTDNGFTLEQNENFLKEESAADRIARALEHFRVWCNVRELTDKPLPVQDVRFLHTGTYNSQNLFVETEPPKMQILIAEGWRSPDRVWSDDGDMQVLEGLQ